MQQLFFFYLLIFSTQNLEANAGISDFLPKVKSFFTYSNIWSSTTLPTTLFKNVPKSYLPASSFEAFYSSCSKRLKYFVSTIDEFFSHIYNKVNMYDIIAHLKNDNFLWNWTVEHCDPCSSFDKTNFDLRMNRELFGQHIVSWSLSKLLDTHLNTDESKKPLILSFHGPAGCGKTFLSKVIVESLFQEGFNSKFVQIYHGSLDFPHVKDKEKYSEKLLHDVIVFSHLCNRSVFIFDDIDDMVPGIIDVLKPYIYFYKNSTMNFTKTIFLFLSNSGSQKIEQIIYDAWLEGISREDLNLEDFSFYLKEAAYNEPGGLQQSEIVNKDFIDAYIPFLPLEKEHVKQCIIKELLLQEKSINKDVVEKITSQLEYYPPDFELFSVSGCKKVAHRVGLYSNYS